MKASYRKEHVNKYVVMTKPHHRVTEPHNEEITSPIIIMELNENDEQKFWSAVMLCAWIPRVFVVSYM